MIKQSIKGVKSKNENKECFSLPIRQKQTGARRDIRRKKAAREQVHVKKKIQKERRSEMETKRKT